MSAADLSDEEYRRLVLANQYEILGELGSGATSVVKLCRRLDPDAPEQNPDEQQLFAVKILQKSILKNQRELGHTRGSLVKDDGLLKLRREIACLKKLVHPNVAQLAEVISAPDCTYLVMEYVAGEHTLRCLYRSCHDRKS